MIDLIREYIKKDPISYIHIEDLLDKDYSIIYASKNGFIIRDNKVNFIYISFSDYDEMKEVLKDKKYDSYLAYEKEIVDFYGDDGKTTNLSQWVYPFKNRFDVRGYDIRKLGIQYLPIVNDFYQALGPDENNAEAFENEEVLGIFENHMLAGVIGRHPEGCIGMLHIFNEYRRKGFGEALEKAKINDLLDRNERIFEEVIEGNNASSFLQEKLGLVKGEKTIYWKL